MEKFKTTKTIEEEKEDRDVVLRLISMIQGGFENSSVMRRKIKKVFILTFGIIFILLGLLGLVLPFLQGIFFLIIGLMILSLYFPKIRLLIQKHAQKSPHFFSLINKAEKWIAKFIGEI